MVTIGYYLSVSFDEDFIMKVLQKCVGHDVIDVEQNLIKIPYEIINAKAVRWCVQAKENYYKEVLVNCVEYYYRSTGRDMPEDSKINGPKYWIELKGAVLSDVKRDQPSSMILLKEGQKVSFDDGVILTVEKIGFFGHHQFVVVDRE